MLHAKKQAFNEMLTNMEFCLCFRIAVSWARERTHVASQDLRRPNLFKIHLSNWSLRLFDGVLGSHPKLPVAIAAPLNHGVRTDNARRARKACDTCIWNLYIEALLSMVDSPQFRYSNVGCFWKHVGRPGMTTRNRAPSNAWTAPVWKGWSLIMT